MSALPMISRDYQSKPMLRWSIFQGSERVAVVNGWSAADAIRGFKLDHPAWSVTTLQALQTHESVACFARSAPVVSHG